MTTVYLYGHLGRRFGFRWVLDIGSPAEAVRALIANRPDFQRYLAEHSAPGYQVFIGPDPIRSPQNLVWPVGKQAIKIVPVLVGAAKSPVIGIIIGVVLIAAAVVLLQPQLVGISSTIFAGLGAGTVGASLAVSTGLIGAGLVIGGISQLLAGNAKNPDFGSGEKPENRPSFAFNGPLNTTAQGHPVPVGYGLLRIGSAVVSAGITTEDLPL